MTKVSQGNEQLSQVVWVAKYGNRHMDWHEIPGEAKGRMKVEVWHELVEGGKDLVDLEVPEYDPTTPAPTLSTVWPSSQSGKFIEFQSEVREILSVSKSDAMLTIFIESCVCYWRLKLYAASKSTSHCFRCCIVNRFSVSILSALPNHECIFLQRLHRIELGRGRECRFRLGYRWRVSHRHHCFFTDHVRLP